MTAPETDQDRVRELTRQSFFAVLREDMPAAGAAIQAIASDYGLWGLEGLMAGWVDTTVGQVHEEAFGCAMSLKFFNADTGELTDVGETPRKTVWAGRYISARIAGDYDTAGALVEALRAEGDERHVTGCVNEVLSQCMALLATADSPLLNKLRAGREPG